MMAEAKIEIPQISRPNGWQKLMAVQSQMSVSKDKDGGRFKYYDIGSILSEAKPKLATAGAVITMTDVLEERGGKMYLTATARFIDADTGETVTEVQAIMEHIERRTMDASQSMGATSTYARKRALAGLLLVDGEEDPDAAGKKQKSTQPQRVQAQATPQRNVHEELRARLAAEGVDAEDFSQLGYNAPFSQMPAKTAADVLQNFGQYLQGYRELAAKRDEEIPL